MMKRRAFLSGLGGAAVAMPLAARAQQALPVIGFLHSADAQSFAAQLKAFQQGLKEGGFEERRNLTVDYRWAEGHNERLPALAADLARLNVAVIVSVGGNASNLAAKRATDAIPIVFNSGSDPIKLGMVNSLSRPGGNITGVTFFASDLVAKQVDMLHQLVPRASSVAVLVNPNGPESLRQPGDAREAAQSLGIDLRMVNALRNPRQRIVSSSPLRTSTLPNKGHFIGEIMTMGARWKAMSPERCRDSLSNTNWRLLESV